MLIIATVYIVYLLISNTQPKKSDLLIILVLLLLSLANIKILFNT